MKSFIFWKNLKSSLTKKFENMPLTIYVSENSIKVQIIYGDVTLMTVLAVGSGLRYGHVHPLLMTNSIIYKSELSEHEYYDFKFRRTKTIFHHNDISKML